MGEGEGRKASTAASRRHCVRSQTMPILRNQALAASPTHTKQIEISYDTIIRICTRLYEYAHPFPTPNSAGKVHFVASKLQGALFQIAISSQRENAMTCEYKANISMKLYSGVKMQ